MRTRITFGRQAKAIPQQLSLPLAEAKEFKRIKLPPYMGETDAEIVERVRLEIRDGIPNWNATPFTALSGDRLFRA